MFQTSAFGEFLIGYLESFNVSVITKTLDDMMSEHPTLDLRLHKSYDPQVVESVGDDLMKAILSPPPFSLLDDFRSSIRLMIFEKILSSTIDEDEHYLRLIDQGIRSSLHPESLDLTLFG